MPTSGRRSEGHAPLHLAAVGSLLHGSKLQTYKLKLCPFQQDFCAGRLRVHGWLPRQLNSA